MLSWLLFPRISNFDCFLKSLLFVLLLFTSHLRTFRTNMETSQLFYGEGLQNLGLSSASTVFEKKKLFIMSHLLWHGASEVAVSSEGLPQFIKGVLRTYSNRTGSIFSLYHEIIHGIKRIRHLNQSQTLFFHNFCINITFGILSKIRSFHCFIEHLQNSIFKHQGILFFFCW